MAEAVAWRRMLAAAVLLVLLAPASGRAENRGSAGRAENPAAAEPASAGDARPERSSREDGRRTLTRLPENLLHGAIGVVRADNLTAFLAGGVVTASASFADQNVREQVQTLDWGQTFETAGGPVWSSVFVASVFTAGRFVKQARFRAMSYDMLDAAIVNFAWTELVKAAVGRERPNGQDNKSFPSGHTSNSFALAAVAQQHYGWKLGVPAYLVAGVVGASRIQQDKHYLSDVVAGATLGFVVGRTVVRANGRPLAAARGARLDVTPVVGGRTRGVRVALSF